MIWSKNPQDEKLKALLKESRQDFRFDQDSTKFKIMQSIHHTIPAQTYQSVFATHRYALVFTSFLIIFTASIAYTSTAKPGERLFNLNKWGEQVVLSLPLSEEQKINLETEIVTKRLEALDKVETEAKILETVKESDESLNAAVEKIISNKAKNSTDKEKSKKMDKALQRLEAEAAKREQKIRDLEKKVKNDQEREKIRNHRERFEKIRAKARLELSTDSDQEDND